MYAYYMNLSKNIDNNIIPEDVLSYLKQLGLSDKESSVYYTLLKVGDVGTSKISKETGLHIQFIYNALAVLIEKGLVDKYTQKKRTKFSAKNPRVFYEKIEKEKKTVDLLSTAVENSLSSVLDSKSVEIFRGREAFLENETSFIRDMPVGSELLVIGGPSDEHVNNIGPYYTQYEYLRNKKDIIVRYIGTESQKSYLTKSADTRKNFVYKYLPGKYNGVMNISILTGVAVTIYVFQDPISTIIIRNKKIIDSYVEFFETLWGLSKN